MSTATMTPVVADAGSPARAPLSREDYAEWTAARPRFNKIRAAARVATFNGWSMGVLALLSAPFAWFSLASCLTTIAAALVAYGEFRGRRRLLQYDPAAATLLGWNQIGLLVLIIAYCLWQIVAIAYGPSPLAAELQANPELSDLVGSLEGVDELFASVSVAFYGAVIALSAIFQGANAIYYFSRRKHIVACLENTPNWAMEIERLGN